MSGTAAADRGRVTARLRAWAGSGVLLALALIAAGVALRTYRLTAPLLDQHLFRQTQTASTVWLFERFGYDPLHYRVPMWGAGNWVLEFPTYQSLVYAITRVTGDHEWVGRVVSITAFAVGTWILFLLVRRWTGSTRAAVVAVAVAAFLPMSVFYSRAFMIDPLVIALTLGCLLAATHLLERFTWPAFTAYAATLLLAALTKPTIVAALGLPLVTLAVRTLWSRATPRAGRLALGAAWLVTLGLVLAWARHSDRVNLRSNGMSYADMRDWYFGSTIAPRLWIRMGDRLLEQAGWLGIALLVVGLVAIPWVRTRHRPETVALVLSAPVTVIVVANLNIIHDYYQLPYVATAALLIGLGTATLMGWAERTWDVRVATVGAATLVIALGALWTQSLFGTYFAPGAIQTPIADMARELRAHTPDERIIVVQSLATGNDPVLFYEARRIGWRVASEDPEQVAQILANAPGGQTVAVIGGPAAVTPALQRVVDRAGLVRTYESPVVVVFSPPA